MIQVLLFWSIPFVYILWTCLFSVPPVIYCFVYYLWVGHNYCYAYLAGFTALFLLPGDEDITQINKLEVNKPIRRLTWTFIFVSGWGPQWLSYLWYLSDGRIPQKSLRWTHILHLGIFKRWGWFYMIQYTGWIKNLRTPFDFRNERETKRNLNNPVSNRWEDLFLRTIQNITTILKAAILNQNQDFSTGNQGLCIRSEICKWSEVHHLQSREWNNKSVHL